jgi:hypothetical protein
MFIREVYQRLGSSPASTLPTEFAQLEQRYLGAARVNLGDLCRTMFRLGQTYEREDEVDWDEMLSGIIGTNELLRERVLYLVEQRRKAEDSAVVRRRTRSAKDEADAAAPIQVPVISKTAIAAAVKDTTDGEGAASPDAEAKPRKRKVKAVKSEPVS